MSSCSDYATWRKDILLIELTTRSNNKTSGHKVSIVSPYECSGYILKSEDPLILVVSGGRRKLFVVVWFLFGSREVHFLLGCLLEVGRRTLLSG